jgi:hypothetical protein
MNLEILDSTKYNSTQTITLAGLDWWNSVTLPGCLQMIYPPCMEERYSTVLENFAWIQLLDCRSSDHSKIATSRSSSIGHRHCHCCTRLVAYEPGLVRLKPLSRPQATLLNSKYVLEICMADVILKRLKTSTSYAIIPTPCMFQYHRTFEQPATRTSIVPIPVAAGPEESLTYLRLVSYRSALFWMSYALRLIG